VITIVNVISNAVESGFRKIKIKVLGNSDNRIAKQVSPFGIDSSPVDGMSAIYGRTNKNGKAVIIGYYNKSLLAAKGETRVFSIDGDGELSTFIWLKADGTMQLAGDSDNLIRFGNTKTVIDEIQNDIASLKQAFNSWVPVPNDGGAALKTAAASWAGTPLTGNIDSSKIDEIKTL
jgi:hypothetical protein